MTPEIIGGIVRWLVTSFGVYLTNKGLTDQSGVEAIGGGLTALVMLIWSIWQKKVVAAKLADPSANVPTPQIAPRNSI
jgi:hypothetical protein